MDRWSLWQFGQTVGGYIDANVPAEGVSMSDAEADEIWAWMEAKEGRVN